MRQKTLTDKLNTLAELSEIQFTAQKMTSDFLIETAAVLNEFMNVTGHIAEIEKDNDDKIIGIRIVKQEKEKATKKQVKKNKSKK